jgi:CspA family cold shock protein
VKRILANSGISGRKDLHPDKSIFQDSCACSGKPAHDALDCASIDLGRTIARVDIRLHFNQEIFVATGTVKWFNAGKGFGFIQADDGSKDVFVHISAVEKAGLSTLNEGQKIQYELQKGQDGKTSAGDLKSI